MKKAFAIFFLSVYLLSTTDLNQLLKFPILVSHFIEHREQDKNITFGQFLYMHYAYGDVKDDDYEQDMKLPFKTHENCSAQLIVVLTTPTFSLFRSSVFLKEIPVKKTFQYDVIVASFFLSSIWQPPRVV